MMDNKWFDETFLPTLFGKIGAENETVLTPKQTGIFITMFRDSDFVTRISSGSDFDSHGEYHAHRFCEYAWSGRTVFFEKSDGSVFGKVKFSKTKSEISSDERKDEKTLIDQYVKNALRIKKHKDWVVKKSIELAREDMEEYKYRIEYEQTEKNPNKALIKELKAKIKALEKYVDVLES